ncbi:hypothetical protein [Cryptosporangium sp. NPDC051539]|uniref:hypothetical protein n=1 Tax=Cryptosporangium sp. NPDC051539 TaxID=3363962 RepID=UPI0037AADB65
MTARLPSGPDRQDLPRPLYARALRLRYLDPGKVLCAMFFEGSIAVAMLLAFADLVSWWGVLAGPVTVAVMVKLNDVVVGRLPDPHAARRPRVREAVPAPVEDARPNDAGPDIAEPDIAALGVVRVTALDEATVPLPRRDEAAGS